MAQQFDALRLINQYGADKIRQAVDAEECERDLSTFFRRGWPTFVASRYQHNWHIDAIADHLMAVADGTIRKLLITVPPRCSKTSLATIAFPAWLWALKQNPKYPLWGAKAEFLCIAYNTIRAQEDAVTSRRLIGSEWYQERWGDRVKIRRDRDNSERFDTDAGGSRISTGINATVLGRGGNIKIIDDPMKPDEPESDDVRRAILRQYDETLSSRENDPRIAAEIMIAQRLGTGDLPEHVIKKYGTDPNGGGWCHLFVPAEYEWDRHCITMLGWHDPRGSYDGDDGKQHMLPAAQRKLLDGTSFWEKRFPPAVLQQRKTAEGPFSWHAKYQQNPKPRGGGIIQDQWWQLWRDYAFPPCDFVLVSVDTASTKDEQNDESGVSVWGVFRHEDLGTNQPQVMLMDAWEGRLELHRLVTKIGDMCKTHKADVCLIEGKANGIDVINEIRRLYGRRDWSTVQFDPKGDKVARITSVQALFSGDYDVIPPTAAEVAQAKARGEPEPEPKKDWRGGIVWAPDRDFAQLVIDRVSAFTGGKQKALALVDTTSQALSWLRVRGYLLTREEQQEQEDEDLRFIPKKKPIYNI